MKENRLKYKNMILTIIVIVLLIVIYTLIIGRPVTIFHTPWFDVVK